MSSFQVLRTNTQTGAMLADVVETEREARQLIAWCATDNLGMTRKQASKEADAARIGEPYALDRYVFTITPVRAS